MPSGSFSKKARNIDSSINRKNCGGNKKGGLSPRATGRTQFRNVAMNQGVNFKLSKAGLPCPENYSNNPGGQCSGGVGALASTRNRGCRGYTNICRKNNKNTESLPTVLGLIISSIGILLANFVKNDFSMPEMSLDFDINNVSMSKLTDLISLEMFSIFTTIINAIMNSFITSFVSGNNKGEKSRSKIDFDIEKTLEGLKDNTFGLFTNIPLFESFDPMFPKILDSIFGPFIKNIGSFGSGLNFNTIMFPMLNNIIPTITELFSNNIFDDKDKQVIASSPELIDILQRLNGLRIIVTNLAQDESNFYPKIFDLVLDFVGSGFNMDSITSNLLTNLAPELKYIYVVGQTPTLGTSPFCGYDTDKGNELISYLKTETNDWTTSAADLSKEIWKKMKTTTREYIKNNPTFPAVLWAFRGNNGQFKKLDFTQIPSNLDENTPLNQGSTSKILGISTVFILDTDSNFKEIIAQGYNKKNIPDYEWTKSNSLRTLPIRKDLLEGTKIRTTSKIYNVVEVDQENSPKPEFVDYEVVNTSPPTLGTAMTFRTNLFPFLYILYELVKSQLSLESPPINNKIKLELFNAGKLIKLLQDSNITLPPLLSDLPPELKIIINNYFDEILNTRTSVGGPIETEEILKNTMLFPIGDDLVNYISGGTLSSKDPELRNTFNYLRGIPKNIGFLQKRPGLMPTLFGINIGSNWQIKEASSYTPAPISYGSNSNPKRYELSKGDIIELNQQFLLGLFIKRVTVIYLFLQILKKPEVTSKIPNNLKSIIEGINTLNFSIKSIRQGLPLIKKGLLELIKLLSTANLITPTISATIEALIGSDLNLYADLDGNGYPEKYYKAALSDVENGEEVVIPLDSNRVPTDDSTNIPNYLVSNAVGFYDLGMDFIGNTLEYYYDEGSTNGNFETFLNNFHQNIVDAEDSNPTPLNPRDGYHIFNSNSSSFPPVIEKVTGLTGYLNPNRNVIFDNRYKYEIGQVNARGFPASNSDFWSGGRQMSARLASALLLQTYRTAITKMTQKKFNEWLLPRTQWIENDTNMMIKLAPEVQFITTPPPFGSLRTGWTPLGELNTTFSQNIDIYQWGNFFSGRLAVLFRKWGEPCEGVIVAESFADFFSTWFVQPVFGVVDLLIPTDGGDGTDSGSGTDGGGTDGGGSELFVVTFLPPESFTLTYNLNNPNLISKIQLNDDVTVQFSATEGITIPSDNYTDNDTISLTFKYTESTNFADIDFKINGDIADSSKDLSVSVDLKINSGSFTEIDRFSLDFIPSPQ